MIKLIILLLGNTCKLLLKDGGRRLSRYLSEMLPFSRNLQKIQITEKTKTDGNVILYEVQKEVRPLPHMSSKKVINIHF